MGGIIPPKLEVSPQQTSHFTSTRKFRARAPRPTMEKTGLPMQGGSRATARWLRSAMWGQSLQPIDGDFGDGLLLGLPLTDFSLCSLMLLMIC